MVALLRGINVGGARKVPMAELRVLATRAGLGDVETYIQSGNLVFEAGRVSPKASADRLEKAIARQFGFAVDVVVRTAPQWKRYASGSPFPEAARIRPSLLLLGLSKQPCPRGAAAVLAERATQGERIEIVGDAIWVDFVKSVGKSKLTPAVFDRAAGSPVTARNWRTVLRLNEMLDRR
jgi:uncharacterized protein (DUF1697 family)